MLEKPKTSEANEAMRWKEIAELSEQCFGLRDRPLIDPSESRLIEHIQNALKQMMKDSTTIENLKAELETITEALECNQTIIAEAVPLSKRTIEAEREREEAVQEARGFEKLYLDTMEEVGRLENRLRERAMTIDWLKARLTDLTKALVVMGKRE